MDDAEDDFTIRTGRIGRDRRASRQARRFVGQVAQAVQAAGGRPLARRGGSPAVSRGRGRGRAWRLAALAQPGRRVVVKARVVRQSGSRFRAAALARHLRYLQREGVTQDGAPAAMFDAAGDTADDHAFAKRCTDDRHHFRFIVSPENADQMADLRGFARELMTQAETDLGTRLDWVAVDHWNTDNPHVHILVRGVADDGADLVIDKAYIAHGLRQRAQRLVDLELGPRQAHEIEQALTRDVLADRVTPLDGALRDLAAEPDGRIDLRPGDPSIAADLRRALLGRLGRLRDLGLARAEPSGLWSLSPELEPTLRALALRGDQIKTLHQAMARAGSAVDPGRLALAPDSPTDPVIGRLVERGLHDELRGSGYAIVEGVDGRCHHLRFTSLEATGDGPPGAIVALRRWTDKDGRPQHGLATYCDLTLADQVAADGATWLDRQLTAREPTPLADGFGTEVAEALAARTAVLASRDLAVTSDGSVRLAPRLLDTLRHAELTKTRAALAAETGLTPHVPEPGDAVAGVYRRRLDLASGRFAMIDDGLGFSLVPWRPSLEPHRGQPVSGVVQGQGVAWAFGRRRGPSL